MFDKTRKSFMSGARGTYRVRDSSLDPGPTNSTINNNNASNGISNHNVRANSNTTFKFSRAMLSNKTKKLNITVIFLDDSQHTFEIEVRMRKSWYDMTLMRKDVNYASFYRNQRKEKFYWIKYFNTWNL